jgi:GDP-4-dehydro-6-deoxy-D-mannose reductase
MKTLITGVDGFIGGWLAKLVVERGDDVVGVSRREAREASGVRRVLADICDPDAIAKAIGEARPDRVFHLAAASHIPTSFDRPVETFTVNAIGTLHVLAAVRAHAPGAVVVSVGSSAEYGDACRAQDAVREDAPLLPTSPYAISKVAQGLSCRLAFRSQGLRAVHVRPFHIVGPGKRGDALTQFATQVAALERGGPAVVRVGNLEPVRDFVDVRDCARALVLLSEQGQPGEAYNVCSGAPVPLSGLLDVLRGAARRPFEVVPDPARMRPVDDVRIVGDPAKLAQLGFAPTRSLTETVGDTLESLRTVQG